jgi:hypothetical protein
MEAFRVLSTNLDLKDGEFQHGYFMHLRHAQDILKGYAQQFQGKEELLDLDGKLDKYQGYSLKHNPCYKKPAVYYLSHWGNCVMVMWIEKIWIQE